MLCLSLHQFLLLVRNDVLQLEQLRGPVSHAAVVFWASMFLLRSSCWFFSLISLVAFLRSINFMTLDSCPIRNLANLSLERLDSRRSSRKQFWHQPWPSSLCLAETKRAEQSLVFRAVELNMGALAPSNNIINFAVNERTYWTHLSLAFLAQAQSLILLPSLYFQRILPLSEIERIKSTCFSWKYLSVNENSF